MKKVLFGDLFASVIPHSRHSGSQVPETKERISPASRRITQFPEQSAGRTWLSEGISWRNPFRFPPDWRFLVPRAKNA
jgi:hypothetical protein